MEDLVLNCRINLIINTEEKAQPSRDLGSRVSKWQVQSVQHGNLMSNVCNNHTAVRHDKYQSLGEDKLFLEV